MDSVVLGLRVLLALACVIGLIWVLARRAGWGKQRRGPAGPTLEVVGRQALGRHAGVAVVAVGNRRLLLGYGEQNVTMLTELAPAPPEALPALTADADPARPVPTTVAELVAAVLPTPRRARTPRPSAAPATPATPGPAPAFEDALAAARRDAPGDDEAPASAASASAATAASAASAASAAAALAAAAVIPVDPAGDVPGLAGLEVADVDAARLEHLTATGTEPRGALHGSVLAPSTWRQAVAALRERTVRR